MDTDAEITKNKSYVRTDLSDDEQVKCNGKIFNFTIDDTIDGFVDIVVGHMILFMKILSSST